jgi:hypothetical protein
MDNTYNMGMPASPPSNSSEIISHSSLKVKQVKDMHDELKFENISRNPGASLSGTMNRIDDKGGRYTNMPREKPSDDLNLAIMDFPSPKSNGNRSRTTKKRKVTKVNVNPNLPPTEEEEEYYDDCVTVDGVQVDG